MTLCNGLNKAENEVQWPTWYVQTKAGAILSFDTVAMRMLTSHNHVTKKNNKQVQGILKLVK